MMREERGVYVMRNCDRVSVFYLTRFFLFDQIDNGKPSRDVLSSSQFQEGSGDKSPHSKGCFLRCRREVHLQNVRQFFLPTSRDDVIVANEKTDRRTPAPSRP